ncbi:uncharacterized protein H6S33_012926 [Morchella sextelata]|jgi:hypothetical protein|uniref:uncharacterized protein n=1 Tax=Morchella sextelata TaxID=1174677 RepID=UPI001D03EB61|nr:uncharacterized protein H6S33_012926 [Morchella sextelata]KAH0609440.1 hypothetical protein H6S33_012926 [Morchella sextelata]
MSSLLTTTAYATPDDLPCEMILSILCLCTSYAELLKLSSISKTWRMSYNSMRSTILAAVTKNIVGPDAFDNLVIVLRYQHYTMRNGRGLLVVDYPNVKAAMSKRLVFDPDHCALVTENQAHYQQASNNFQHSLPWEHQLDLKMSSLWEKKEIPVALFYEMWVAALRFGLESIADWSKHEENKKPMGAVKFLDYRLAAQCMLDGKFVAVPRWAKRAQAVYELGGSQNCFFDILLRAYGAEGHLVQAAKCSSHYTRLVSTGTGDGHFYEYSFVEFYDFLSKNPLEKVIEKYDLDSDWL